MNDKKGETQTGNGNNAEGTAQKDALRFDWVTERSSCSLPKAFSTLRAEVEQDVNTRNGLRPNLAPYEFSIAEDTAQFAVFLKAKELQKSVSFSLSEHAIVVRDDQGQPMFEVTLAFDENGRCRFTVNAEERELWQVRRMALEDLMFRGL